LVLSSQLNHYQEGDGPSCCYAILILEFTPSYWTLLFFIGAVTSEYRKLRES
jgi:hypothetical protein